LFSGGPGGKDPERLTITHYNVQSLIVRAYDLQNFQISGLDKIPESDGIPLPWIQVDPFDIIAKVPPGATKEEFRLMLQSMLAERFGLKVHFEKRDVPTYNLVVAKSGVMSKSSQGLILSSTVADDDAPRKPFTTAPGGGAPFASDKSGFPIIPKDSMMTGIFAGGRNRQLLHKETMEKLAAWLAGLQPIGRPVRDATGLKDEYDFSLYWTQEAVGGIVGQPPQLSSEPIGGPPIFEALEKQLGLKLEPSKGPVDFLVIDHIDRTPTEN
jgi:uncharacterized protein (TIGR03435 family)